MATVNLIDVSKQVGTVNILNAVNLTIKKGEFIVVVGPSGCGKSTSITFDCRFDELSSGQDILLIINVLIIFLLLKEIWQWFFKIMPLSPYDCF